MIATATPTLPDLRKTSFPELPKVTSGTTCFNSTFDRGALGVNGVYDKDGTRLFLVVRRPQENFPGYGEQCQMLNRAKSTYTPADQAKVTLDENIYSDALGTQKYKYKG